MKRTQLKSMSLLVYSQELCHEVYTQTDFQNHSGEHHCFEILKH